MMKQQDKIKQLLNNYLLMLSHKSNRGEQDQFDLNVETVE